MQHFLPSHLRGDQVARRYGAFLHTYIYPIVCAATELFYVSLLLSHSSINSRLILNGHPNPFMKLLDGAWGVFIYLLGSLWDEVLLLLLVCCIVKQVSPLPNHAFTSLFMCAFTPLLTISLYQLPTFNQPAFPLIF